MDLEVPTPGAGSPTRREQWDVGDGLVPSRQPKGRV